jgi:tetratricopeptide (TPR) repeat protein
MAVSNDLFILIKSLSKSEKRFFKLHSSFQKGDKYALKLFDAIDKQEVYDEEEILLKFKKDAFTKQFSAAKYYVFQLILKSLRTYNSGVSIESEIKELMDHTESLYKKHLNWMALKSLNRAKTIAYKYEKYTLLPEIFRWERMLNSIEGTGQHNSDKFFLEMEKVNLKLKNIAKSMYISDKMFLLSAIEGQTRTKDEQKKYDILLADPFLKSEKNAITNETLWRYYNSHIYYYRRKGNFLKANEYCQKAIKVLENMPSWSEGKKDDLFHWYISSMSNQVLAFEDLKNKKGALEVIQKLRAAANQDKLKSYTGYQLRVFTHTYIPELELHIESGHFEKGLSLVDPIKDGLKKFKNSVTPFNEFGFYITFTKLFIIARDYKNALLWITKSFELVHTRINLQPTLRLMNLVIHYELNNWEVLDYFATSSVHYMKKRNKVYQFELTVLNHLKKISSDKPVQLLKFFVSLKKELLIIIKDPYEKKALENFDFISWVDSKIEKKTFAEILKRKSQSVH